MIYDLTKSFIRVERVKVWLVCIINAVSRVVIITLRLYGADRRAQLHIASKQPAINAFHLPVNESIALDSAKIVMTGKCIAFFY